MPLAFWALVVAVAIRGTSFRDKPAAGWVLDLTNLAVQGGLVPVVQAGVVVAALATWWPERQGTLAIGPLGAFVVAFVAVDYLYYWNHRLLHQRALWPTHAVHHTITRLDVFGTSRNTLWTTFLILYWWAHGALIWAVDSPVAYAWGVALTSALDLWRHSGLQAGGLGRALGAALVTPAQHARHHATDAVDVNFGANWNLWDRLHGTFQPSDELPERIGVPVALPLHRQLLWPFP